MRAAAAAGLVLLLAGPAVGQAPTRSWLVGAWVAEREECAGAASLIFDADGMHRGGGGDFTGTWSLKGTRLTVSTRAIDTTSGKPVGRASRGTATITRIAANELRLDRTRYRRCPLPGGREPWHRD